MNRFRLVYIPLLMLFMFSCDKNETEYVSDLYRKWEVTEFIMVDQVDYLKINGFNPLIEFRDDGTYNIKLDMNMCIGTYNLTEPNKILVTTSGCTKICCDSEFSNKFVQMLPRVQSFLFEKNKLILEIPGWGLMKLQLYN